MGYFEELYLNLQQAGNPFSMMIELFRAGLWIIFFPVFIVMARDGWLQWVQNLYKSKQQFVLMAVDVPRENEQSMVAVEHIISSLHGVFFNPNFKEKWWDGVLMDKFGLEIVSIDGYIQYFVYCANYNVDLMKGAVYAQYPDAEIIEVEDYTPNVPQEYPNDTHDLFGTEFVLYKPSPYPIKTYDQFEHSLTGVYADPMAAILELMSRLRKGEQVWLQFMITPQGDDLRAKGLDEVNKLIGKKSGSDPTRVDRLLHSPIKALEMIHEAVFSTGLDYSTVPGEEEGNDGNFLNMTTGEKLVVEEIQKKISKLIFRWKFRFIYVAPKEMFDPFRVAGSVYGSVEQFNTLDMNYIGWGGKTVTVGPVYYLKDWRQNWRKRLLMVNYVTRSDWAGEGFSWLSTTEIASLFHFPTEIVKAPLVSKASARTSEPPTALPLEGIETVGADQGAPAAPAPGIETVVEETPVQGAAPPPPPPPMPKAPPPPPSGNVARPGQLPPSLSGEAVQRNIPQAPARPPGQDPNRDYPLHSMPGLPPGVKPVEKATVDTSPTPTQQQRITQAPQPPVQPAVPPVAPAPMPPQQPQQAPAPQVQPQPPQQQDPNQPPPGNGGAGGTPPPNLPIG